MHHRKTCLSLVLALAVAAAGALAADAEHDQHHPGTSTPAATAAPPAMSGMAMGSMPGNSVNMPMMDMMQLMMGRGMTGRVGGRIAFLKAELKITDAQQTLWNAVAEVIRANAKGMSSMPSWMPMIDAAATLPEKLARREKMMTAHLDGLRKLKMAVEPLYAALNAEQKKTADELMMAMGML